MPVFVAAWCAARIHVHIICDVQRNLHCLVASTENFHLSRPCVCGVWIVDVHTNNWIDYVTWTVWVRVLRQALQDQSPTTVACKVKAGRPIEPRKSIYILLHIHMRCDVCFKIRLQNIYTRRTWCGSKQYRVGCTSCGVELIDDVAGSLIAACLAEFCASAARKHMIQFCRVVEKTTRKPQEIHHPTTLICY